MPLRTLPLNETVLAKIRRNIRTHCDTYSSDVVDIRDIGREPAGRRLVEADFWPIDEAIRYFEQMAVAKREDRMLRVLDLGYFAIDPASHRVPVSFSIDARLEADLLVMLDAYAQLYDVENRLRFLFHEKLCARFGDGYLAHLPAKVRDDIAREKEQYRHYVVDGRRGELDFSLFPHLKRILTNNEDFVPDATSRILLQERLDYLSEARNFVAHHNLLSAEEVSRIKESCAVVRRIIQDAHGANTSFKP